MRGSWLGWMLVLVGGGGLLQCAPPSVRAPRAPRRVSPPVVKAPRVKVKRAKRPPLNTPCAALLAQYKRQAAKIRYPASLPIRTMLPIGEKLVQRYRLRSEDAVCVVLLRSILGRYFERGPLPDGVDPVRAPGIAGRSRR